MEPTVHPKILKARRFTAPGRDIAAMLARLREEMDAGNHAGVRRVLFAAISGRPELKEPGLRDPELKDKTDKRVVRVA